MAYETRIVRSVEEIEDAGALWDAVPWTRDEAERPYLLTRVRLRPEAVAPFGILVGDGEAALAGRVEERRLATTVGYKVVYAPRVRLLQVVDGGIVAGGPAALARLVATLRSALEGGEVDAVALPPLEVGSELDVAFASLGSRLRNQHLIAPWTRRRLVLPASFEEFVASRSSNTRWRIRREERRFAEEHGDALAIEVLTRPEDAGRLVRDVDRVARAAYQRKLGAGFAATPEQRALAELGLERGWLRAWLLYAHGEPIAYWLCSLHGDTILIRTAGYDDAWAEQRVGVYLLMRVIRDAIDDPALRILDFGPGDAAYKQQFSNESRQERNLVVFAPTFRGVRINAVRTAVLGSGQLAKRVLDATNLTGRVRSGWRKRLA